MFFSVGYFSHYRGCSDENDILLNFQNFKFPETQIADDFTLLDSFLLINFYWELYLLPMVVIPQVEMSEKNKDDFLPFPEMSASWIHL